VAFMDLPPYFPPLQPESTVVREETIIKKKEGEKISFPFFSFIEKKQLVKRKINYIIDKASLLFTKIKKISQKAMERFEFSSTKAETEGVQSIVVSSLLDQLVNFQIKGNEIYRKKILDSKDPKDKFIQELLDDKEMQQIARNFDEQVSQPLKGVDLIKVIYSVKFEIQVLISKKTNESVGEDLGVDGLMALVLLHDENLNASKEVALEPSELIYNLADVFNLKGQKNAGEKDETKPDNFIDQFKNEKHPSDYLYNRIEQTLVGVGMVCEVIEKSLK